VTIVEGLVMASFAVTALVLDRAANRVVAALQAETQAHREFSEKITEALSALGCDEDPDPADEANDNTEDAAKAVA
jgi:hypothetical protein